MNNVTRLHRTISLPYITLYGLGTILGAGIYVLIGKVAGLAGMYAPWAFLLASVVAGSSAFSYAELSSRFPKSAGESAYILEAFNNKALSIIIGLLVVFTGIVSAATLLRGFVGYFQVFIPLSDKAIIIALLGGLTLLAAWGIKESVAFAAVITILELVGLVIVIAFLHDHFWTLPERIDELIPTKENMGGVGLGIVLGGYLAFYAFIGFEDMVNMAEEVHNPHRNLPLSIFLALLIATILYFVIAILAVLAMPPNVLAQAKAPFAALLAEKSVHAKTLISIISLTAIVNGVMVQLIMASRVLYGMSAQQMLHGCFSSIHPRTKTPLLATFCIAVLILAFSLLLPIVALAKITSFIVLIIFTMVNLALIWLKPSLPPLAECPNFPRWLPLLSVVLCLCLMVMQVF